MSGVGQRHRPCSIERRTLPPDVPYADSRPPGRWRLTHMCLPALTQETATARSHVQAADHLPVVNHVQDAPRAQRKKPGRSTVHRTGAPAWLPVLKFPKPGSNPPCSSRPPLSKPASAICRARSPRARRHLTSFLFRCHGAHHRRITPSREMGLLPRRWSNPVQPPVAGPTGLSAANGLVWLHRLQVSPLSRSACLRPPFSSALARPLSSPVSGN